MTPYGNIVFFIILGILLMPTIILGLRGKSAKRYNIFVSIIVLALIFGNSLNGTISLILFTVFQLLLIIAYQKYRLQKNSGSVFVIAVLLSILPLVLVKVFPILGLHHLFGFLGVSYITFKSVQMILETRDGLIKDKISAVELAYFLLFFPTVSSGPIDRWRRFSKDMYTVPSGQDYQKLLLSGINYIFVGFLYKFILAYLIYNYTLIYLPNQTYNYLTPFQGQIAYMYMYSFYLFFDFAGYSAFAVGVSRIMGIQTPINFNRPFSSRNIKDFWNRWHMSLSFWFRDYVYMRFVLWMTKKKWIKNKYAISYIGFFLLFFLMGIWHGLEWHFVVYGLYHALLIISFDKFERWNKKHKFWPKNKWTHAIGVFITFNAVCFGFYIFSGTLF
ncbi:D-alanyl-lipoteichoic acid biosynthesis protein DltB [Lysinibacillus sp. FJAT-14222]|uniref:D-alanyl-lipoteichoic acid biosynthesis protein DltB n=1 Tax=Lysinibacillus sp. FJAT-14222 TaxID=1932366 RepID=UPI0006AFB0BA|nr:D-alanyl-lipoteichoic acid biosynthesis protein DltB [Lysinibacillus sp. FJAT-14222]KOS63772.1 alanine transporter [Lysinibacillus sp. FJAT-14222]